MSTIHNVTILNKPLKIRGFTIWQWCMLVLAAAVAFALGSWVPGNWKVANVPLGFWVGLLVFSAVLVFIHACEMKPAAWWKNILLYRLKIAPSVYLPHSEIGQIYPDPTIVEQSKKIDDYYVR